MDSLTHVAIGSVIGGTFFQRSLGRRAMIIGAIAASFPDIDVVYNAGSALMQMYNHRGITHSIIAIPIMSGILGYILTTYYKYRARHNKNLEFLATSGAKKAFHWLILVSMITHPLLDSLNSYGIALLEPFTDKRYALNAIGVIDLWFTVPLWILAILQWIYKPSPRWAMMGKIVLTYMGAYVLVIGIGLQAFIKASIQQNLPVPSTKVIAINVYPSVAHLVPRRAIIETQDAIYITPIDLRHVSGLQTWVHVPQYEGAEKEEAMKTKEFAMYATVVMNKIVWVKRQNSLIAYDYRYVQVTEKKGNIGNIQEDATLKGNWGLVFQKGERPYLQRFRTMKDTL